MKKRTEKKLRLNRETILNLKKVTGGLVLTRENQDVFTDTDGDTFPSGGPAICYFSDCNPCETQIC